MSGQNNEVNRVIDDTAEGHARALFLGDSEEGRRAAERKAALRTAKVEDAETEGHRVMRAQEAEELRARAIRAASFDDDEAEGHRIAK